MKTAMGQQPDCGMKIVDAEDRETFCPSRGRTRTTGVIVVFALAGLPAAVCGQTLFAPSGSVGATPSGNNNVGIATSSPQFKFDVNSTSARIAANNFGGITFENLAYPNQGALLFSSDRTGYTFAIGNRRLSDGDVLPILTMYDSGRVGIGTTTPTAKLHVAGDAVFSLSAGQSLTVQGVGSNTIIQGPNLYFLDTSMAATASAIQQGVDGAFGIWTYNSGWGERLHISRGGYIGIGTTAPAEPLSVYTTAGVGRVAAHFGSDTGAFAVFTDFNAKDWGIGVPDGSQAFAFFEDRFPGNLGIERMRIAAGGNVGIGTTAPTHKLSVNGTIKAKEVIVETTGWSDYVFADDYHLAPLSEVEAHIKAERRLPGIPFEQQVAEHGVSVGEMQAALLLKIEELTLHQIAQQKLIEQQADLIAELMARFDSKSK